MWSVQSALTVGLALPSADVGSIDHTDAVDGGGMGGGSRPGGPDRRAQRLVSDAERDATVARLGDAMTVGALTPAEFDERVAAALAGRRAADLAALTADLPVPTARDVSTVSRRRPWWRRVGFDYHATCYVLVNGMLVGIWGLTGHHFFWPFFPIAGWGVGLGAHAAVASNVSHRNRRTRDLGRDRQPHALVLEQRHDHRPGPLPGRTVTSAGPGAIPRYVAVVFADMVDSTSLNEQLGDAAFNEVRTWCLAVMRDCVSRHSGAEVSTQGDGLFARFATPAAALAAAIDMQHEMDASPAATPPVRLHVGVHAGQAIEDGADLIGNMVNVAARVATAAAAGEVLVTEPVADLAGEGFAFEDRGMHSLKGVSTARHLLAVRC